MSLIKIFKLGLPIGIQYSLYPISNTIVQANINKIGVDSIVAWAVCGKLDFLIWAISDAFSASLSAFVAQNYGAKKYDNIRKGLGDTFRPMLVTVLGICLSRILWILAFLPFKPKLITVLGCYPLSWGITAIMIVYLYLKNLSKSRLSEAEA